MSGDDQPSPDEGRGEAKVKKRGFHWRPSVWLTTLSTVVAVATGMFTLRDQIFPGDSGGAQAADPGVYPYHVGAICTDLNNDQKVLKAANAQERKHLRAAATATAAAATTLERNAILDSWNEVVGRSEHDLVLFEGISTPAGAAARQHATVGAWTNSVDLEEQFVQRLTAARTGQQLMSAVSTLPALRKAVFFDSRTMQTGLVSLGGDQCSLNPPVAISTVSLPPAPAANHSNSRPSPALAPDVSPTSSATSPVGQDVSPASSGSSSVGPDVSPVMPTAAPSSGPATKRPAVIAPSVSPPDEFRPDPGGG